MAYAGAIPNGRPFVGPLADRQLSWSLMREAAIQDTTLFAEAGD